MIAGLALVWLAVPLFAVVVIGSWWLALIGPDHDDVRTCAAHRRRTDALGRATRPDHHNQGENL